MITLSDVLSTMSASLLQDVELDENNMACVRFTVGDQTWKVHILWDLDNEDLRLNIRKRD